MKTRIFKGLIFLSCLLLIYKTGSCLAENELPDAVGPVVTTSTSLTKTTLAAETANGSPPFSTRRTSKGDQFSSSAGLSYHSSDVPSGFQTSTIRTTEKLQSTVMQDSAETDKQKSTETTITHFTTKTSLGLFNTQKAKGPLTSGSTDSISSIAQTTLKMSTSSSSSATVSGSNRLTESHKTPSAFGPPTFGPPSATDPQGPTSSSPAHGPPPFSSFGPPASLGPPGIGSSSQTFQPPTFGPPSFGSTASTGSQGSRNSSTPYGPSSSGPSGSLGPPGSSNSTQTFRPSTYGPPAPPPVFTQVYNRHPENTTDTSKTTQISSGFFTSFSSSWIDWPWLYTEDFNIVDFIKSICRYTKSCRQGNGSDITEPYDTCCLKCDCSDDCFAKGNCCYDKELPMHRNRQKTPTSLLNESCVFPTYGQTNKQELMVLNKKSFLMIAHCPDKLIEYKQPDNQSTSKKICESPELAGMGSILDVAPVYSSEKLVSYLNHHCAKCNDATESLISWNHTTLSCPNIAVFTYLFKFSTNIETFLLNIKLSKCTMGFHPPNNNSVDCLHPESIISDCDANLVHAYNTKIRDYCKNVTIPFRRNGKIYKNLFCVGCNEFSQDIYDFPCENYMYGFGYDFGSPDAEIDLKALEEGLFANTHIGTNNNTDKRCEGEEGFVYNDNLKQCLTYVCAPSKVNVSGQCLSAFKTMKNIALDYKVTYRFLVGTASSGKYFYAGVTFEMVYSDNMVRQCRSDIKTMASLRDYHVTFITLESRLLTEMTNIEKEFTEFKQRYETFANHQEQFGASLGNSGYDSIPIGQLDFVRFNDVGPVPECPESIAMVDLQFCDAVMFRINSDQRDNEGMLQVNTMKFKSSEYLVRIKQTNGTDVIYAQICRDLFSKKLETLLDNDNIISGVEVVTTSSSTTVVYSLMVALILKTIDD